MEIFLLSLLPIFFFHFPFPLDIPLVFLANRLVLKFRPFSPIFLFLLSFLFPIFYNSTFIFYTFLILFFNFPLSTVPLFRRYIFLPFPNFISYLLISFFLHFYPSLPFHSMFSLNFSLSLSLPSLIRNIVYSLPDPLVTH